MYMYVCIIYTIVYHMYMCAYAIVRACNNIIIITFTMTVQSMHALNSHMHTVTVTCLVFVVESSTLSASLS